MTLVLSSTRAAVLRVLVLLTTILAVTTGAALAAALPAAPATPSPMAGASAVAPSALLTWAAAGATTFDLAIGTSTPPAVVGRGLKTGSVTPTLAAGTTYFWQVTARNAGGTTLGPIWSFSTVAAAPAAPGTPSPAAGASAVVSSALLSWTAAGATTFDLAVGTSNPPVVVGRGLKTASVTPTLAAGATYFWQVTARNAGGTTLGPVWSFTVAAAAVPPPPPPPAGTPNLPLVQAGTMAYQGAFRLGGAFAYGGGALTYNAARNTLLVMGPDGQQQVAEIGIPAIGTGALATLATAPVTRPLTDLLEGRRLTVDGDTSNGAIIGGLWPFHDPLWPTDRLAVSVYDYYDSNGSQTTSHFVRPLDPSVTGQVFGPTTTAAPKAGFTAGYFAAIPKAWQAVFGGSVLNGLCCTAIISRTSSGPSAWVINPADIGVAYPVPVTPLVYYPFAHPLGAYGTSNPYYNGTGGAVGAVFPEGTGSLLFIGSLGAGTYCYGSGTPDPAVVATSTPTDVYCLDPTDPYKSPHAYPYVYRVWAYDAKDLAAVKAGTRQPWDVKPYAYWDLTLPTTTTRTSITGVAYDPGTGRIFIGQGFGDGDSPVVHVFTIVP